MQIQPLPIPKWNPQYFYMCPKCYITYGYSIKRPGWTWTQTQLSNCPELLVQTWTKLSVWQKRSSCPDYSGYRRSLCWWYSYILTKHCPWLSSLLVLFLLIDLFIYYFSKLQALFSLLLEEKKRRNMGIMQLINGPQKRKAAQICSPPLSLLSVVGNNTAFECFFLYVCGKWTPSL